MAVVKTESGFRPKVVSPAGAKGLMQLMPGTDEWLDGDIDGFDVEGNLDNGCMFLNWLRKYLVRKFPKLSNQDLWRLVWAGYNAGPGNVKKMLELALNEVSYEAFDFAVWRGYLPEITGKHSKETIAYVQRVEKYWKEYTAMKEKEAGEDTEGSVKVSRTRISSMLLMINSMKKELEQWLDESNIK
jgi:soluble lytic murein transglycosylase-like protein